MLENGGAGLLGKGTLTHVSQVRHMAGARWTRCIIAFVLVLATLAAAAAPHRHGLTQVFPDVPTSVAPHATIADADLLSGRTSGHEHPCGACARQQGLALAPSARPIAGPRAQTIVPVPAQFIAERPGQDPNVWLRGPPSATSFC